MTFKQQCPKERKISAALCQFLVKNIPHQTGVVFEGDRATLTFPRDSYGTEFKTPRINDNAPFKLTGMDLTNAGYEFTFALNPGFQLLFTTSTGFHQALAKIGAYSPLDVKPQTLEAGLSYTTPVGEWNGFPRQLLPFLTKFSFGRDSGSNPAITWPDENNYSENRKRSLLVAGMRIDDLVNAGLVTAIRTEYQERGVRKDKIEIYLTQEPWQVMRTMEDMYREANPNEAGVARFALSGNLPVEHLLRIPLTYDLGLIQGRVKASDFLMTRECDWYGRNNKPLEIYVTGLENAARIENLLQHDPDLKVKAYAPSHPSSEKTFSLEASS